MNYLTLEDIKRQCVINLEYTDEDAYLTALGDAAEDIVEKTVNKPLTEIIEENNGNFPSTLRHAIKMLVEYLYSNRGSDQTEIPKSFYYLCQLYRFYD